MFQRNFFIPSSLTSSALRVYSPFLFLIPVSSLTCALLFANRELDLALDLALAVALAMPLA